ncbi:Aste57867_8821 [Aphanomyces stellatus]|uniref:Aste57867_8821 protein n=1 Tax=Aphanomyces stellatus TaxID=120398 RepID=A0A485KLF4_9STRA|nr:hypothetical protein As57867_008786 [Aphanomyces stellatus]VFT85707.1 Aste57867_8821 [Aphanomyces stellatus]
MKTTFLAAIAATAVIFTVVEGHGRLIVPPHRGYMGRLPQFSKLVPIDYDDNGLNAGGVGETKKGTHGICGDPYTQTSPRDHENGGMYGRFGQHGAQVVGGCFAPGATMNLQVQVTANHMGHFNFQLCKLKGPKDVETEACFQQLVQPNGQPDWPVPSGNKFFDMQYVLPKGLTCEGETPCVLRWEYIGSNNWGDDPLDQEHFWNCADIYISNNCAPPPPPTLVTPSPTKNNCGGQHGVCFWPLANQTVVGYTKAQCAGFTSFVWCD